MPGGMPTGADAARVAERGSGRRRRAFVGALIGAAFVLVPVLLWESSAEGSESRTEAAEIVVLGAPGYVLVGVFGSAAGLESRPVGYALATMVNAAIFAAIAVATTGARRWWMPLAVYAGIWLSLAAVLLGWS